MTVRALAPMDALQAKAEDHRARAESLVRGIEALTRNFAALDVVPLDVLDRCERALTQAHASNLLRLGQYVDLGGDE